MTEFQLIAVAEAGQDSQTPRPTGAGKTHDALLFSATLQASMGAAKGHEAESAAKETLTEQESSGLQDVVSEDSDLREIPDGAELQKRVDGSDLLQVLKEDARAQAGSLKQGVASKETLSHRVHQTISVSLNQEIISQADDASGQNRNSEPVRNLSIRVREEDARSMQNLRSPVDLHLHLNEGSRDAKGLHIQTRPTPAWHTPESVTALSKAGDVNAIQRPASHSIPEVQTPEAYSQFDLNTDISRKRLLNNASRLVSTGKSSLAVTEASWPSAAELWNPQAQPLKIHALKQASAGSGVRRSDPPDSSPDELIRVPIQQLNLSRSLATSNSVKEMELLSNSSLEGPARFVIEEFNGNGPVQRIRIQLEPQHLGRVNIFLRQSRGGIHARVVAEQAEALPMVESQMDAMRAALSARGIEFTSFTLTAGVAARSSGMKQGAKTTDKKQSRQTEGTTTSDESEVLEASPRKARVQ